MTTVREIIQDALIEIGALSASDAMPAEDAAFGLRALNRMIGVWNTDELMVYTVNRTAYNLVAGQQVYTLGTGGDFNVSRPVVIQAISVLLNSGTLEVPIDIVNDTEWQETSVKGTTSTFPTKVWITGNMPLNSLYFWPVPSSSSNQVVLYTWGKTDAFTDLSDSVVFPQGYEEALVTNLGITLASSYGVQVNPALQMRAAESKSRIQSINIEPVWATFDGFGSGGGSSKAISSFGYQID